MIPSCKLQHLAPPAEGLTKQRLDFKKGGGG